MKHGRHASDYEKVRKSAGFTRPRYEPAHQPRPEFPEVNINRIDAGHADFKERMAAMSVHEQAQLAERQRKSTEFTLETGKRLRLGEYRAAHVEPPFLDADGVPKFSLSFLCRMGWTIEMIGHENKLVSPVGRKIHNEGS